MICLTVYKKSGQYQGFECVGHAGYAEDGYDIICAAVSALTVNAANSIETFTRDPITCTSGDGLVKVSLTERVSEKTKLLLDSMIFGLQNIQKSYGNEYLEIVFKEV
ncbi:MAG: ribosomal-processing cysteine protease Prp [Eubacteriales bacterium]|nr:ribosomal-processing cysteine protease Prp [Eubacteriales bacterium]